MNKETKHFLLGSVALLSLVVAGCSTEKKDSETTQVTTAEASTEETTQVTTQATAQDVSSYKTDGTQPSETFNWEATVAPLKNFEKEYIDYKGNRVKEKSASLANAVLELKEMKSKITDSKVLEALKLLDSVFIDQGNIGELLKEYRAKRNFIRRFGMILWYRSSHQLDQSLLMMLRMNMRVLPMQLRTMAR